MTTQLVLSLIDKLGLARAVLTAGVVVGFGAGFTLGLAAARLGAALGGKGILS